MPVDRRRHQRYAAGGRADVVALRAVQRNAIERIEGRLLDLSAGGCRLEAASSLGVGRIGVIEMRDLLRPIALGARVCRSIERPGASARYVMQFEFVALPDRSEAETSACNRVQPRVEQVLPGFGERSDSELTKCSGIKQTAGDEASKRGMLRPKHANFADYKNG